MNTSPLAVPASQPAVPADGAPAVTCPATPAARRIVKRLGIAGFAFFFIKGLLWLIVPTWLVSRGCVQ